MSDCVGYQTCLGCQTPMFFGGFGQQSTGVLVSSVGFVEHLEWRLREMQRDVHVVGCVGTRTSNVQHSSQSSQTQTNSDYD